MKQTSSVNRHQSQKEDNENTEGVKKGCQQKCRSLKQEAGNYKQESMKSQTNSVAEIKTNVEAMNSRVTMQKQ